MPRILTSLNSFRPASFSLEVEESLELAVEVCLSVQISLSLNFLILCSPVVQTVESLPAMQETWVSPWVRNIPWSRKWHPTPVLLPGKSHGWRGLMGCSPRGRKQSDTTELLTSLSLFTFMHWRRKWQPSPVFLPGESQRWGSLVGCCLWGRTELDTTKAT